MATIAASPAARKLSRPINSAYDRRFYSGMAIAMALTVFAGFAPTYYGKLLGDAPLHTIGNTPFTTAVHVHGALFTAWVLLFIVQTALVATHRVAVHRRLGIAGGGLAALMVIAGLKVAIDTAARGSAPAGSTPIQFFAIPFFDIVMFASFVGTAMWWRKSKEAHKRLMLLAYLSIITAAVARFPGMLAKGPLYFFGFSLVFLVAGVVYDAVTRHRVHPAYIWGGAALILSGPLRMALAGTAAWASFAEMLIR